MPSGGEEQSSFKAGEEGCCTLTHPSVVAKSSTSLIGWGNGGNVTSAGWQVILCDPMWHVSSRSGVVLVAQTAIRFLTFLTL